MDDELTNGNLVLSRTKDVIFNQEDEVYFMLANYYSRIAFKSNMFMVPYIQHVYKQKKRENMMNWWRRKARYPFRLLSKLFGK